VRPLLNVSVTDPEDGWQAVWEKPAGLDHQQFSAYTLYRNDGPGTRFENLGGQRLRSHRAHAHLISLTVFIGESQDLARFDAQAGTQMVAEFAGKGECGSVDLG